MSALLQVDNLSVRYGGVRALNDVSLAVGEGQIITVLGPNGAGKTSLLRGVGGLEPAQGSVSLRGVALGHEPAARRARRGIGHVLEGRHVFPDLTVTDNLRLGSMLSAAPADAIDHALSLLPELRDMGGRKAGRLSGGQQQMLAIARALAGSPAVLLLDEPTNGLAPILVDRVVEVIKAVQAAGVAVLLVEQRLEMTRDLDCDVIILRRGSVLGTTHTSAPDLEDSMHAAYLA